MSKMIDDTLSGWGQWVRKRFAEVTRPNRPPKSDEVLISKGQVRILSIDGGGIRGILPSMMMLEIERRLQKDAGDDQLRLADCFDVVAGTSTGGVLALGLTTPGKNGRPRHDARALADMYVEHGHEVFDVSLFKDFRALKAVGSNKYPWDGAEKVIRSYLGDGILSESLREVLITTYCLDSGGAKFFKRRHARADKGEDFKTVDVAKATCAAPTYFPPVHFKDLAGRAEHGYIDGGVVAHNPALCAVTEARRTFPEAQELIIVSLGTGWYVPEIDYRKAEKWGGIQWARPLVDILFNGPADAVDHQLREMLPTALEEEGRYFRFQPKIEKAAAALDDATPKNIDRLQDLARTYIDRPETQAMLDRLIPLLLKR